MWKLAPHRLAAALLLPWLVHPAIAAPRDKTPGFAERSLALPGMPAAVIPADMNGDGHEDLVVLVAYVAWGETATTEQVTFDDIEGLVEVMNVVSALVDRRELRVYLAARDGGGYEPSPTTLDLGTSIHALAVGGPEEPLLALTDDGVAAVRYGGSEKSPKLSLEALLRTETTLAGSGSFYAEFEFLHDLDGDGHGELLLPTSEGWSIFERKREGVNWTQEGFAVKPSSRLVRYVPPPSDDDDGGDGDGKDSDSDSEDDGDSEERSSRRRAPLQPEVADQNGDGRLDLLVSSRRHDPVVYLNRGGWVFADPVELALAAGRPEGEAIVHVGSLTGASGSSVVSQTEVELPEDAGMRMEIDNAKRPDFSYGVYPLDSEVRVAARPRLVFEAEGYTFEGNDEPEEDNEIRLPGGFQDLDGDGRLDLVAITLDFSILPMVVRALVTRSISLRMDFHPWCQQEDGSFRRVLGLDLSGKFKINLRNVQIKHLSQFAGDFNGDGRADFVQLGRGKKVTIHHGGPGCDYPEAPSRTIHLKKEPKHLGLVRILDLNDDGRSDVYVVHPQKDPKSGESAPVRLDLYLSETG